jgi:hypothetical protein
MTEREEYEALWAWFKALDASTETARANIGAALASNRAEDARSEARIGCGVDDEHIAVRGELTAACV